MEKGRNENCIHPRCIIVFDSGLGVQSETIVFGSNNCYPTFTLGNGSTTTDPTKLAINQNVKAALNPNQTYIFDTSVLANSSYGKPPRKSKIKVIL